MNAKKLITLDDLLRECGFFGTGLLFSDEELPNDGYVCRHPNQTEKEDGFGLCEGWSCPIACLAHMSDFKKLGPDLYDQYTEEFPDDDDIPCGGETWMLHE